MEVIVLKQVRTERTGWRDEVLEQLLIQNHMEQPNSFLVTEYNYGKSVAIIEYKKYGRSTIPDPRLCNYCSLRKNKEFYFIVLYDYEKKDDLVRIKQFYIYPGNDFARNFISSEPLILSEPDYIKFLYQIRGNTNSVYQKQALEDYEPWFKVNITFDEEKQIISSRHRHWAYDVPAADIDCILCDSKQNPYLFIEFKENNNYGTSHCDGHNSFIKNNIRQDTLSIVPAKAMQLQNKAIIDLGDGLKEPIPVLAVEYNLKHDIFTLYALNNCAQELVSLGSKSQTDFFDYIKNPEHFKSEKERKKLISLQPLNLKTSALICPQCGGVLLKKKGIYGPFYGCTNYFKTGCHYTKKIFIS